MTLTRKPMHRSIRNTGPDEEAVVRVLHRATPEWRVSPCCEVCGGPVAGERGVHWALHHRKGRDGARTDNSAPNLLLVHGASNVDRCHGRIHGHGGVSQDNGWMISRNGVLDPLDVAVLIDNGSRYVYFTADGEYADAPPPGGVA